MSGTYYVKANIHQGYSFKCLVKYLTIFNVKGELVFYEDGIRYDKPCDLLSDLSGDAVGNIVNQIFIKSELILDYHWIDTPYCDYDKFGRKCYKVGLNLLPIDKDMKTVGKSSPLNIVVAPSKSPGSKYQISFSVETNNLGTYGSVDNIICFNTYIPIEVPEHKPFAKVISKNFITAASKAKKIIKGAQILMSVYEEGLEYSFIHADGKRGCSGKTTQTKNWITNYAISAAYTAAFKSLSQFSPGGLMRFYYQPTMPLKISFNVGTIGEACMYIAGESVEYADGGDLGSYEEVSEDEEDDEYDE